MYETEKTFGNQRKDFNVRVGRTDFCRTTFEHFDIVTHCASGVLSAWFGYDFANIIYRKRGDLGPAMSSLFSITFALGIAVGWEVYEFTMDSLYGMTLQRGNTDTMVDFIACAVGAVVTMLLVAFYRNGVIGKNKEGVHHLGRKKYPFAGMIFRVRGELSFQQLTNRLIKIRKRKMLSDLFENSNAVIDKQNTRVQIIALYSDIQLLRFGMYPMIYVQAR